MLTWIAIAYYVRVQQQWDPTLGFPGEGEFRTPNVEHMLQVHQETWTRTVSDRTPNVHGRMRDQEPQPQRGNSRDELDNLARYANESSASS